MSEAVVLLARLIEFLGALIVAWAMLRAGRGLVVGRLGDAGLEEARLALAHGVVGALGFMTAATLLKTINLRSWSAIGMFAVILALRFLVKLALAAEVRNATPAAPAPR